MEQVSVDDFDELGFAGPFPLATNASMTFTGLKLEALFQTAGPNPQAPWVDRHLDSPVVAELATDAAIVEHVVPIMGTDVDVWASIFVRKGPSTPEVPWHQDSNYWQLEPLVTVTAWIAIDRSYCEDHCLEVVPGSHKTPLPHVPAPPGSQFEEQAVPGTFDPSSAVFLEMDPGTFVLFDVGILHHSRGGGESRRLALSVRLAPSAVKIPPKLTQPLHRRLPLPTG